MRTSLWLALAEIGGLTDGFNLIAALLVSPVAAALFERDLVKKSLVDPKKSSSKK